MQSNKIFYQKTSAAVHCFFLVICIASAWTFSNASVQFETKGSFTRATVLGDSTFALKSHVPNFFSQLLVRQDIAPNFNLYVYHQLFGAVRDTSFFPEVILPSTNTLEAGLTINNFGLWDASYSTVFYKHSQPIFAPYVKIGEILRLETLNTSSAHWFYQTPVVSAEADMSFFILDYKLEQLFPDTSTSSRYGSQRDGDLWTSGQLALHLPLNFFIAASSMMKNDLNDTAYYNFDTHQASIGGDHEVIEKKWYLAWSATEYFRRSASMYFMKYHTGYTSEIGVKTIVTVMRNLYLKANGTWEFASPFSKQYAEIMIRYYRLNNLAWRIGGFSSTGSIVPRAGLYGDVSYPIKKKLIVAPSLQLFWHADPFKDSTYKFVFYRYDAALECKLALFKNTEITTEIKYLNFQPYLSFTRKLIVSLGMVRWY
ncbi:MAG: hypothetical protein JW795_15825 [Chitinivibrionales bacterium]|nr:hypothetical protein [Chitinivibrionales bacterium]